MIKLEYDQPIEVTKEQRDYCAFHFAGLLAHREENGKYYIKMWHMKYSNLVEEYLNQ